MAAREEIRILGGRRLRYHVRRSLRARRLGATVSRRKGLEVVLPRGATQADVDRFFIDAADWIHLQVDRHGVWDGPVRRNYATGSTLLLFGRSHRLVISLLPAGRVRENPRLGDDVLHLELAAADIFDPRAAVERAVRRFAVAHLRRRTAELAAQVGLHPTRVVVGERVTRWGSCSRTGTVSYCYRLVMAPPAAIDAVVLHELCHLRYLDHGPRFKRLVTSLCPDHDLQMDWLRSHGEDLEI